VSRYVVQVAQKVVAPDELYLVMLHNWARWWEEDIRGCCAMC